MGLVELIILLAVMIIIIKKSKAALRLSKEKFSVVTESIPNAILIFQNNKVIFANNAAIEITQLTKKELFRQINSLEIIHPGDLGKLAEVIKNFNDREIEKDEFEIKIIVKGNNEKWLHCIIKRIFLSRVPSALVTIYDITEQKKSEMEKERFIEELQASRDLIEQNAEELSELNRLLGDSEKKLKRLNSDKDKFFSIISHDLRSPFNSLIGFSDILANEIDDLSKTEVTSFASSINIASKNLLALLNSLLEWSRLNNGKMKYQPEKINLNEIAEEILTLLSGNAIQKNIHLDKNIPDNTLVFADRKVIYSVLQNLVSNAIKFSYKNGVVVICAKEENDCFTISIRDNGMGISERDIKKLFRIDVHHSTRGTENETGSGLGLILCKNLIELNKGCIRVESKIGEGSTFYFTLPKYKNDMSRNIISNFADSNYSN